jgi:hypothetical protein
MIRLHVASDDETQHRIVPTHLDAAALISGIPHEMITTKYSSEQFRKCLIDQLNCLAKVRRDQAYNGKLKADLPWAITNLALWQ